MKDSSRTLKTAERDVGAAVDTAVATFLARARDAVLGTNISADVSPAQLPPNLDRWPSSAVWDELARRHIQPAIGVAFDSAFDVAARTDLLQQHRYRQTYMDQVSDRLSQSLWPSEAFDLVRGDLAEGLDAGESVAQLRARVGAALGVDRHGYQAERIARTEAHTATEGGSWSAEMAWQEATGEELFHLWDAALDGRTRPDHADAHNQIRPISDPFTVGGYLLMFPGDPAGPAHLVINCRCSRLIGTEDELRSMAGLAPNTPPVETPQERIERILTEAVDGDEALGRVMSASDLHASQRRAFVRYTGSAYMTMNKAIRQAAAHVAPQAINNRQGRNPNRAEVEEWERLTGQAPTANDLAGTGAYGQYLVDQGVPRQDAATFAEMNKGFAGEPIREPVKLYRGVEDISRLMGRDHDLLGMEFGDAAVVSSSADLDVAKGFAGGGPVLEILADAGTPAVNVTPISQFQHEREVIFPQGTRFRVVSDETRDDGQRYVQVEPVGAPGWRPTPRQKTTRASASPTLTSLAEAGSSTPTTTRSSSPTTPYAPTPTTVGARTVPSSPGGPMTEAVVEITQPTPDAPPRLYWRAAMVPLDSLADYRVVTTPSDGVVKTTDLMWLKWQERDAHRHDDSVTVGRVDRAWIQDGWLWGEGEWDLADRTGNTAEVIRKVQDRFAGTISVDLRDGHAEEVVVDADGKIVDLDHLLDTVDIDDLAAAFDRGEYKFLERVHDWRLEGCTLVQSPAYYTSRLWVLEEDALTAAITGNPELPLAPRDTDWDRPEALRALQDAEALSEGCFWRDPDADADSNVQGDYKLPFATVIDGTVTAIPAGIMAVAGVLQGAMGGVDIPEADIDRIRTRVQAWYERMAEEFDDPDLIAPWVREQQEEENVTAAAATGPTREEVAVITAAAGVAAETSTWADQVAQTIPLEPPAEWFTRPDLTGPTKVRVLDTGRVYGHLATWDTAHVGMPGQSITPPRSATGYAHFQRNRIRCSDGTTVWAGTLVMGTGHADTRVSSSSAMAHYDDTGYAVADIVCGEDQTGIWFSGSLKPGASPLQILTLDRYSLSGDWRGGELVGACVVNVPGFPIAENELSLVAAATGGTGTLPTAQLQARRRGTEVVALVASGILAPTRPTKTGSGPTMADLHQRLEALPSQVYSATLRAQRESAEFAALARQMEADELASLAARMKAGA